MRFARLNLITSLLLVVAISACKKNDDVVLNQVPVADAGLSKVITLPASVTLTGAGSDADGEIKAYLWSQVSGPAPSIITNPGNTSTTIQFSMEGTYIFQLMVTDDMGATGVDTAMVTVNPAPEITLILQPSNNPADFLVALRNGIDVSGSGAQDIPVEAWTFSGAPFTIRSLLKFDLSTIPQNATIISANLYLYSYPAPTPDGNFTDANFGSANAMTLQQVGTNWSPTSVTWFNQPPGIVQNQVAIPHASSSMLDLNLDVKGMVSNMVATNSNYGFLMKLQNEVTYNCRIFISSYNTTYPTKHPKLVIVYK